ncbi:interferon-induced protein 44 isoform X2 [Salmo salar]|uniref:Interferon-induced protein 44 isoform X2 n=1 Tax=Salmo salar TaxID=8030 RepID=A0A1S3MP37_SALSA|nr:interferon-induced protein 44-like isoform X2 [Salmo salar]|eukprot:XP_014004850.1 PREDICTED: interferon-induced protein 44-like isoform X2 [Salmo salar]
MSFNFGMVSGGCPNFSAPVLHGEKPSSKPLATDLLRGDGRPDSSLPWAEKCKSKMESPWRDVAWTEDRRETLMESISSYKPGSEALSEARVLLVGPVGAGKSSFISSVQSVFTGRFTNRAMVGSSSASFTKKLQLFNIRGRSPEQPTALVLCDVMGLGDGETTGLTLHDTLAIIKGHAPEGHKFSPEQPVRSETVGYVKKPSLKDKVHCVVFVVDASKVSSYTKGLGTTFQQLREHISDLGVHQVALLTHVDKVCQETARDITQVYNSRIVQQTMTKAGALLGMSTSYIVPVKNYSSELDVDENTDILLLSAVDHILQYVDLYFQDCAATYPKLSL